MEILNQGVQESGPNAGCLTVLVRVRRWLLDFLQSVNLKYVKLMGYHYLISLHVVYLFSVLVLLMAYSAEIGRVSQQDLRRLWEQPHFDMTTTLTFSGATVFMLCLYQYDRFACFEPSDELKVKAYPRREKIIIVLYSQVKAYPRRENMKVHFLGILLLTATLLEATDAVCNNRRNLKNGRVPLKPCRNLVLYYHDILYNGSNDHNATSAIVAAPKGDNLTALASNNNYNFGQMVVFDDPLTLDNNLHSPPVGRAQGFYFYDLKNTYGAWFSFTIVLNSTDHKGTITLAGADPTTVEHRDISVVGGTGDFFMTRGIATLTTDTFQGDAYFRLRLNITLYECH